MILIPAWQSQVLYNQLLHMSLAKRIILPSRKDPLRASRGLIHPLVQNRTMQLVAWTITGKVSWQGEFQEMQPALWLHPGDQVRTQITHRPGKSGLAGVVKGKLIHFEMM